MLRSGKTFLIAAPLSFLVYAIPIIGPHSFVLLGQLLLAELAGAGNRERLWIAADLGIAVVMQFAAFGAVYWFVASRKYRGVAAVAVLAIVPVLIAVSQLSYLVAIPSAFLIEDDTEGEKGSWPVVCTADNAYMTALPMPRLVGDTPISEVIVQDSKGLYAVLRIPSCEVLPLPLSQPTVQPGGRVDFMLSVNYFVPGAGFLFQRLETATGRASWAYLKDAASRPVPFDAATPTPVLSTNGESIGWVERTRILVRTLDDAANAITTIDLGKLGTPNSFTLLNLDVEGAEIMVAQGENVFLTVGFDGEVRSSIRPDNVAPQSQTFLKTRNGWVAWDAYQDRDAYRLRWMLPEGSGKHEVLKGRGINSVSTNPSGKLVAVSVTTALNIGKIPDAVYVLDAKDGTEVFRRYFPTYSRSQVLFAGDEFFVYTSDGKTYVLRIE